MTLAMRLEPPPDPSFPPLTRAEIERALTLRLGPPGADDPGGAHPDGEARPAAVLCPIFERKGALWALFVRRADHLRRHAGQIGFPGGKIDPEDPSPRAAALREAHEEIGLAPGRVEIVGRLASYRTITGFSVTPFVGFVDADFRPTPDPGEVAEVFAAPLDHVLNPALIERRSREDAGRQRFYYAIPYKERLIWGATAGMLKSFSELVALWRSGKAGNSWGD